MWLRALRLITVNVEIELVAYQRNTKHKFLQVLADLHLQAESG